MKLETKEERGGKKKGRKGKRKQMRKREKY